MTPLERVEALHSELTSHYGDAKDREIRAAAKLLLVALDKFRTHGGTNWFALIDEYVQMVKHDPAKFERVLLANHRDKGENSDS